MASTSQDSSFGDENNQDQDPLAIEPKVYYLDFTKLYIIDTRNVVNTYMNYRINLHICTYIDKYKWVADYTCILLFSHLLLFIQAFLFLYVISG